MENIATALRPLTTDEDTSLLLGEIEGSATVAANLLQKLYARVAPDAFAPDAQ